MGLPADSVSDALLESLHGRTGLTFLRLGHEDGPPQMDITAAAVTRSVRLHTTQAAVYLLPTPWGRHTDTAACSHPGVDILTHGSVSTPWGRHTDTLLYIYALG